MFLNFCSPNALYINLDKLGLWSGGKWGSEFTELIGEVLFVLEEEEKEFEYAGDDFEEYFQSIVKEEREGNG